MKVLQIGTAQVFKVIVKFVFEYEHKNPTHKINGDGKLYYIFKVSDSWVSIKVSIGRNELVGKLRLALVRLHDLFSNYTESCLYLDHNFTYFILLLCLRLYY